MEDIILYDWFSMTSKIDTPESLIELLGLNLDNVKFIACNGMHGYRDRLSFEGINIHYNGREDMGIWLEMSGKGCRAFETYAQGDWSTLFYLCNNQPDDYNLTRLDVAFDDHTGVINLDKMAKETLLHNYVSRFKERSWSVDYSGKGTTVYLGSPSSDILFRCYDKAAERDRKEEGHWVRFEMQLRDKRAKAFIALDMDIGSKFYGVINNYVRFVKPSASDSDKRRWKTRKWWATFCKSVECIKLYTPCDTDYNLAKCEDYVYHQAGNALDALIRIKGIDVVVKELRKKKPVQSKKYIELMNNNSCVSEDPVLQFLKERGAL